MIMTFVAAIMTKLVRLIRMAVIFKYFLSQISPLDDICGFQPLNSSHMHRINRFSKRGRTKQRKL